MQEEHRRRQEEAPAWSKWPCSQQPTAHAATRRARRPPACSKLSPGPERRALATWMPRRGCGGAPVPAQGRRFDRAVLPCRWRSSVATGTTSSISISSSSSSSARSSRSRRRSRRRRRHRSPGVWPGASSLHPARRQPASLHPAPRTRYPAPGTPHPVSHTRHSAPGNPHPALRTLLTPQSVCSPRTRAPCPPPQVRDVAQGGQRVVREWQVRARRADVLGGAQGDAQGERLT